MSLDPSKISAPLDPFHTVLKRRKAGMENENIKKTFSLSKESVAIIQSTRTPFETSEGEVINRIVDEWKELKALSNAYSIDTKESFSILESIQIALDHLKGTITELNKDLLLGERKDFQIDLEKIHSMIRSHKSNFAEMEKSLQLGYESISKGIAGMRVVLPQVQKFSDDLEGFKSSFQASFESIVKTNEQHFQKFFHDVFESLQKIEGHYKNHLKSIDNFPNSILEQNKEMVKAFEIQRELSNQEYAQRTAKIGEYLEKSQADLEKRFKSFRLNAYILVGIPALSFLCGSLFLFFSHSALEKMAIDETLLSHVRPLVENYAQKSMQEQTESLLQLKKNSEEKINDLVLKEGERVANAVAQYRTETEKSFKELGEYKGYAASLKSELNESKSEVNSLQKEVSQLNRKIEGRFGFIDILRANILYFLISFSIVAASTFFLGHKYGRKTS